MSIAFKSLIAAVALAPVLLFIAAPTSQSLQMLVTLVPFGLMMRSLRNADLSSFRRATFILNLAACVPALWMLLQLLPVPFASLQNSIWATAAVALDEKIRAAITIDYGATLSALIYYFSSLLLVATTTILAKDRRNAEILLGALLATSTVMVAALSIIMLAGFGVQIATQGQVSGLLASTSALGVILSLAAIAVTWERNESPVPLDRPASLAIACASGCICLAAFVATISANTTIVLCFGILVLVTVQSVRRARLPVWFAWVIVATLIFAAVMIVLWRSTGLGNVSYTLRFATQAQGNTLAIAERMISDSSWLGSGAGSYQALWHTYRELGSSASFAPTTAAAWLIELGVPMTIFICLLCLALVLRLLFGALKRGRDSMFATVSGTCTLLAVGYAFCNASLLHPAAAVLSTTIVGLGLGQIVSTRNSAPR